MYDGNNTQIALLFILVIVAYLLGNLSPSILMAKARGIDIKQEGSGNAGTTNALRVMGRKAGILTLIIDVLKGVVAVVPGGLLGGQLTAMLCLIAVICGHVWPVFYRFKGGKGVATTYGALIALSPLLGLAAVGVLALGVAVSQRMSVGSLAGAASIPILAWFLEPEFIPWGIVMAVIIIIKHRQNIARLFKGEEPKLSLKKQGEEK